MIDPNIYLALAAMLGGLFYHYATFMDAKSVNPNLKHKYSYFIQTGVTICLIAGLYQAAEYELSFFTVITAFITGLGGNFTGSLITKRKK